MNKSKEKGIVIKMKNDKFGTIMHNGKIIDLDKADISDLEKVATDLREREKSLKGKILTVFKQ